MPAAPTRRWGVRRGGRHGRPDQGEAVGGAAAAALEVGELCHLRLLGACRHNLTAIRMATPPHVLCPTGAAKSSGRADKRDRPGAKRSRTAMPKFLPHCGDISAERSCSPTADTSGPRGLTKHGLGDARLTPHRRRSAASHARCRRPTFRPRPPHPSRSRAPSVGLTLTEARAPRYPHTQLRRVARCSLHRLS